MFLFFGSVCLILKKASRIVKMTSFVVEMLINIVSLQQTDDMDEIGTS